MSRDPVASSRPRPAALCLRGPLGRGGSLARMGVPLAPRSRASITPARPGRLLHALPPACNAASLRAARAPSAPGKPRHRPDRSGSAPFRSVPTPSPRRGQGRRFKSFKRNKYMNALSICRAQSFYRLRKGRAFKVLPLKTPWTALLETSLASNENMLCLIPNIPGLAYHLHLSR